VPIAFVTLRTARRSREDRAEALVGERSSRIYVPDEIRFVDALPENSVGKVDRKALRQLLLL
jgi:acyl-coenzyme A synthetase/AMP-(fatty) acid ligase